MWLGDVLQLQGLRVSVMLVVCSLFGHDKVHIGIQLFHKGSCLKLVLVKRMCGAPYLEVKNHCHIPSTSKEAFCYCARQRRSESFVILF